MSGGGGCDCGSNCSCGDDCNCGMYPDLDEGVTTTTKTLIMGVAPSKGNADVLEGGATAGAEDGGCPCGDNCKCDPCTCGK